MVFKQSASNMLHSKVMMSNVHGQRGFTIVELLIVIIVIGILATIGVISYNGVTNNARDKALLADINSVESELGRYAVKSGGVYDSALNWDSSVGSNPNIIFTPTKGNVIVVQTSGTDYCIKAYNPASNSKTLATAVTRGECS